MKPYVMARVAACLACLGYGHPLIANDAAIQARRACMPGSRRVRLSIEGDRKMKRQRVMGIWKINCTTMLGSLIETPEK